MGFIGTFSYYKTAGCDRASFTFVYFIHDVFEVKSDGKEDFKSSWKHAVVKHRTLARVNLQCRVKPHRPLPFAFRWWIANVRDKQTFSMVSVSMTRYWPDELLRILFCLIIRKIIARRVRTHSYQADHKQFTVCTNCSILFRDVTISSQRDF